MSLRISIIRSTLAVGLICLGSVGPLSAAFADAWPISFTRLAVPMSAYGGAPSTEPMQDCQPELFDPKTSAFHPVAPAAPAASGVGAAAGVTAYQVEGGEPGETMAINSRVKPDDARIDLPAPVTLTRYIFSCPGGSSETLDFEKNGKRYAIFTHVAQVGFTTGLDTVVFYNYGRLTRSGGWQQMRAIFNIPRRRFAPLPVIRETTWLAGVGSDRILTYGLPRAAGAPATAAVWGLNGKLIQAFSLPLQPAAGGKGTADAIGLLPAEETTLYHLARSGENAAVLRLQDIRRAQAHRAIALAVPGGAADPVGARVQFDLSGLSLNGGAVKYRVSASGKGDDWGPWQTAQ
jgi:hypothetical protein